MNKRRSIKKDNKILKNKKNMIYIMGKNGIVID